MITAAIDLGHGDSTDWRTNAMSTVRGASRLPPNVSAVECRSSVFLDLRRPEASLLG